MYFFFKRRLNFLIIIFFSFDLYTTDQRYGRVLNNYHYVTVDVLEALVALEKKHIHVHQRLRLHFKPMKEVVALKVWERKVGNGALQHEGGECDAFQLRHDSFS